MRPPDHSPSAVICHRARAFLPTGSHIERCKDLTASIEYCSKEDSRELGPFEHGKRPNPHGQTLIEAANTLSRIDFLQYCVDNRIQCGYYQEAIRLARDDTITIREVDPIERNWINHPILKYYTYPEDTPKSLVIEGTTGTGKTTWARVYAPKPALWVTHLDDLKKLNHEHKSIIFDDMDFKHMPRSTQLYLVDRYQSRSIHVRYGTVMLPKDIHRVFTCNQYPFIDDPAIERRVFLLK